MAKHAFSILVLALIFALACKTTQNTSTKPTVDTNPAEPTMTTSDQDTAPESDTDPPVTTTPDPEPAPTPDPAPEPEPTPEPTSSTSRNDGLPCSTADFDLVTEVNKAAERLSGTPYSQANKTDCSGMYHKLLDELRKGCPEGEMPLIDKARSTRDLAAWYHKKGQFQIVRDPAAMEEWIQPGAVMFYGYGKRLGQYNDRNLIIDSLTVRGKGINHVSIVTSVKRVDGQVVSYKMFHGRNPRKPAGITSSERTYRRHPDLPMYGNWKETWVGVVKRPMLPAD